MTVPRDATYNIAYQLPACKTDSGVSKGPPNTPDPVGGQVFMSANIHPYSTPSPIGALSCASCRTFISTTLRGSIIKTKSPSKLTAPSRK